MEETDNQGRRERAPRNRTISLTDDDVRRYSKTLRTLDVPSSIDAVTNVTICQDFFDVEPYLPSKFIDLLFIDPPYNLTKTFNGTIFRSMPDAEYEQWIDILLFRLRRMLKETASLYVCCDWRSSSACYRALSHYFTVRNRITWEREKGRGAEYNWKNCSEDIWFATVSDTYTFNRDDVKLKRKVIAPYRDGNGNPKDWSREAHGNYRLTHPSNLWTDLTVPFWSMAENTDHPTQKPEKLLAKLILASSNRSDFVFDPFLGSGTTSVVAKKLARRYSGVEVDQAYACLVQKRLEMADADSTIQGYADGVFWERNTFSEQLGSGTGKVKRRGDEGLVSRSLWELP